jgi:molybdopterin synthase catalytic subunit
MRVNIIETAFEPQEALARFEDANRESGAIASFIGRCRPRAPSGAVQTLELEHYPGFSEREIMALTQRVAERFGLRDVAVIHRVGVVHPGEAIVLAAAASDHRAAAFDAVETLMDYLKTDAPLWKRETTERGAHWIEPTAQDEARRERHER